MNEEYLKKDGYFRVIKIVSEKEIIINGGTLDGLNESDDINIIVPGDAVIDSYDFDKNLGSLDLMKDTLTIKTVTPYYSICHKLKTEVLKPGLFSQSSFSGLAALAGTTRKYEVPLNINESEITKGYPESSDPRILLGDYARKKL